MTDVQRIAIAAVLAVIGGYCLPTPLRLWHVGLEFGLVVTFAIIAAIGIALLRP